MPEVPPQAARGEARVREKNKFYAITLFQKPLFTVAEGRECDEALFSEKKGFSVKRGEAIQ